MQYDEAAMIRNWASLAMLVIVATAIAAQPGAAPEKEMSIEWSEGPRLPTGLGGHVAAAIHNHVVVLGGTNWVDEKKYWRDQIWVLDDGDGSWREAGKLPIGLALFAAAVHG